MYKRSGPLMSASRRAATGQFSRLGDPLMSARRRAVSGRYSRGLGDTSVVLANGMRVSGPSPTPTTYQMPIRTAIAPAPTSTITSAPRPVAPYRLPTYTQPGGYNGGMNLAQLQQLAQTNPASLTPQQFALLQSAGTIPTTLPYSSAPQLATAAAAADTTTAVVSTDALSSLSAPYGGLPLYAWILIGGAGLYLITRKGR